MSDKTRKNLGLLLIAVVIAAAGLFIRSAYEPIGSLVLLGAAVVAAVAVVEIGLELLRD